MIEALDHTEEKRIAERVRQPCDGGLKVDSSFGVRVLRPDVHVLDGLFWCPRRTPGRIAGEIGRNGEQPGPKGPIPFPSVPSPVDRQEGLLEKIRRTLGVSCSPEEKAVYTGMMALEQLMIGC